MKTRRRESATFQFALLQERGCFLLCASALLLLALPASVQAQDFTLATNNGTITITKYTGPGGAVTIPGTLNGLPVASIGAEAFRSNSLTSVTIPNSVTSIGDYAFFECASLIAITVDSLNSFYSSIDGVLFNKSHTTLIQYPESKVGSDYTIPDGVTSIESYAFNVSYAHSTNLVRVTLPSTVTSIGAEAFSYRTSLTSVTIPDSVTNVGFHAFLSCTSLTSITIPNSVTSIGWAAFDLCASLSRISVDALNSIYSSVDGVLFNKSQTDLIRYPEGKIGNYIIPEGVTSIEGGAGGAFAYCGNLTSVTIPGSVTSIGQSAFAYCTSLASVTIPGSVNHIGEYSFAACINLTGVYFQGNAPSVGYGAFFDGTVYYLPGTTGWGTTFGGRPTALWKPQVQTGDASFGVRTNQFGFNINWSSGMVVVAEACTDLAHPIWSALQTNTLNGGSLYFSDPRWTNYPVRFYRLRSL